MPALRNIRHERFAQLLASGKTAKDAYALAGYKPSESNGAWLARKEEISSRVADLNNQALEREQKTAAVAAERAAITRQGLIDRSNCASFSKYCNSLARRKRKNPSKSILAQLGFNGGKCNSRTRLDGDRPCRARCEASERGKQARPDRRGRQSPLIYFLKLGPVHTRPPAGRGYLPGAGAACAP